MRLRLLLLVIARAVAIGGALCGAVLVIVRLVMPAVRLEADSTGIVEGLVAGVLVGAIVIARQWRVSSISTAREIETREPTLDNLVITAAELSARPRPVPAEIRDAIFRQAEESNRGGSCPRGAVGAARRRGRRRDPWLRVARERWRSR